MGILTGSWNTNCALEGEGEEEGEKEKSEFTKCNKKHGPLSRVERTLVTRTLNLVAHVHTALRS